MMVGKRELASYRNRKLGLKKKAQQLSVLCGIDLCLLVQGPDTDTGTGAATLETWPPVEDRVAATIHSYRLHHSTVRPAKKRRLAPDTAAASVVVPDHIAKWQDLDKLSHQEFYDRLGSFSDLERIYLNGMMGSAVEALNQSIHRASHTTIDDFGWDSAALQELTSFMDDCDDPIVDDGADQNHVDWATSSLPPPPPIGWDFDWTHMPPMDELSQMLEMDDGADQNHVDWATSSPPPPPSIGCDLEWTHMPLVDELRQMLGMDDDPAAPVDSGDQHDDCMSMASSSSFPPPNSHFNAAAAWNDDDASFNSYSISSPSSSIGCSGGDFHFQCSLSPNLMPTQNYTADEVYAAAELDHLLASWIAIE